MIILITVIVGFLGLFSGKVVFRKWVNPLSSYCFVWVPMIILYELKLIRYTEITFKVWIIILFAFLSYVLGILTYLSSHKFKKFNFNKNAGVNLFNSLSSSERIIKVIIIVFGVIGILGAFQHWSVLLAKYGTIPNVFLEASKIYRLRTEGEIKGIIPYIGSTSFIAIFFSGLYYGYKNRLHLILFLPFIGLILKSLADVSRANMLLGFLLFFITYFFVKNLIKSGLPQNYRIVNKLNVLFSIVIVLMVILTMVAVKTFRNPMEKYNASSQLLRNTENNIIISPTIYLYSSAHIGVLSQYFKNNIEEADIGENTFLTFYRFASKFDLVPKKDYYQKGYFIPMWTNTGTYLREIHADFGYGGLILIPYFLGLFLTYIWFEFYTKGTLLQLLFLVYLQLIVLFSFLTMVTRLFNYSVVFILLFIIIQFFEKYISKRKLNYHTIK